MKALVLLVASFAPAFLSSSQVRPSPPPPKPNVAGRQTRTDVSVPDLLARLKSRDEEAAGEAADALEKRGAEAIPFLEQFLKTEKQVPCLLRAAAILSEIKPDDPLIVPTLLRIAKGRTLFDSEETLMTRRAAGMLLAQTPAGVRTLPALLKDGDTFVRRSAAFALDDPTEVLASLSPDEQAAIDDVIPAYVEALDDGDEVVRGMSCEVLAQIVRSKVEPLSSAAERLLKASGKSRGDCLCECD
jgi:HEAT repeat protein